MLKKTKPLDAGHGGEKGHEEITRATIERLAELPKEGKDVYVQDAEVPGFRLRRTANGTVLFLFVGRIRGGEGPNKNKLVKRTIGPAQGAGRLTVAQARAVALRLRDDLGRGIDPADEARAKAEAAEAARRQREEQQKLKQWTVAYALEDMLADRAGRLDEADRLRPETIRYYRNAIASLGALAGVPVAELNAARIRSALRRLPTVATQAKTKRALSGVISHALRRLDLSLINPVSRLDRGEFAPPPKRTGYLAADQVGEFVERVCHIEYRTRTGQPTKANEATRARDYLLLTLLTGCRKQELMRMEWSWVDWQRGTFTIPASVTKNGFAHTLPMTEWMRAILEARFAGRNPGAVFVFPGNIRGRPLASVKEALAQVAGPQFKLHDLRRTLATHCEALEIRGTRLKAILNHADAGVTEGYVQRDMTQMRADLERYHGWIAEQHYWYGFERAFPDAQGEATEQGARQGVSQRRWPGIVS